MRSEPAAAGRTPPAIAAAFVAACRDELAAPKPGNVHLFADGHRMTADDFVRSAVAAAPALTAAGASVGARILHATEASFAAAGANTNLGIILLCAPLAAAAEQSGALRPALARGLAALDRADADLAFRAIVRASPAGLGRAPQHDVFAPAAVSLREAMAAAADRDRIARQYVTDFADVFELGLPRLAASRARTTDSRLATLAVYLAFLSSFRDSHIERKYNTTVAKQIRQTASHFVDDVASASHLDDVLPAVLAWDTKLKNDGINPGTSADLTVATLFVDHLQRVLPPDANSG